MHLYAISDLHLGHEINRNALLTLPAYPDDWLIVAGDVGETETHLRWALTLLTDRFAQVIWAPGNHDLWTLPAGMLSGQPLPGDTLRGGKISPTGGCLPGVWCPHPGRCLCGMARRWGQGATCSPLFAL